MIIRYATVLAVLAMMLGGCGGGGGSEGSGGNGSGGSVSRYLYVSAFQNSGSTVTGEIRGYKFDTASGNLVEVAGSPFAANTSGAPIAITRDNNFIYSSNNNSLIALSVQADGSLTPVPGSPFATSEPIGYVVTNPGLDYLYTVGALSSNLTVYSIDTSTGALTQQATYPGVGVSAITPDGKYLYDVAWPAIDEYSIDPGSGALSPLSTSPSAAPNQYEVSPAGVAMDPQGRFLYVTNGALFTGFGAPMYGWTIDPTSGALSLVQQQFQPTPGSQGSIVIDASGKYAIVDTPVTSKTGPNCFSVLSIDAINGMLANVFGSPFPDSGGSCGLFAADPSAPYVYAAGESGLYVYTLDEATGVPSLMNSIATPSAGITNVVTTH